MPNVKTIGIIGAGQMGGGIAHVAAQAGYRVILQDLTEAILARSRGTIEANMAREVKREKLTAAQAQEAQARIGTTTELAALGQAQLVIEAATENEALKFQVYDQFTPHLAPEAVFASNTSSISITRLGAHTPHPERFIGIHFFNPVPMMELVEVIRGMATNDETYAVAEAFVKRLGKTAYAAADSPGFIVNRIFVPMLNEAVFALHEGVGSVEAIDAAMKLGLRHPMGPLTLADYVGLDTMLAVMRVLYAELGDPKYRPCPLLVRMVEAGWVGVKAGKGFYDYSQQPPRPTV
jgi:3-hydroxybutyryl-CoA dehydrogenase